MLLTAVDPALPTLAIVIGYPSILQSCPAFVPISYAALSYTLRPGHAPPTHEVNPGRYIPKRNPHRF
jgi:hypothetical protein